MRKLDQSRSIRSEWRRSEKMIRRRLKKTRDVRNSEEEAPGIWKNAEKESTLGKEGTEWIINYRIQNATAGRKSRFTRKAILGQRSYKKEKSCKTAVWGGTPNIEKAGLTITKTPWTRSCRSNSKCCKKTFTLTIWPQEFNQEIQKNVKIPTERKVVTLQFKRCVRSFQEESPRNISRSFEILWLETIPHWNCFREDIPHSVCCCPYHENFSYVIQAIGCRTNVEDFLEDFACNTGNADCMFSRCENCASIDVVDLMNRGSYELYMWNGSKLEKVSLKLRTYTAKLMPQVSLFSWTVVISFPFGQPVRILLPIQGPLHVGSLHVHVPSLQPSRSATSSDDEYQISVTELRILLKKTKNDTSIVSKTERSFAR